MTTCKSCGANIEWHRSPLGRWVPYDLNGNCHFDTCPQAKKWRGKGSENNPVDYSRIGVKPTQKLMDEFIPD